MLFFFMPKASLGCLVSFSAWVGSLAWPPLCVLVSLLPVILSLSPTRGKVFPGSLHSPGYSPEWALRTPVTPPQPAWLPLQLAFQRPGAGAPFPCGRNVGRGGEGSRLAGQWLPLWPPRAESRADSSPSFSKRGNSNSFLRPQARPARRRRLRPDSCAPPEA